MIAVIENSINFVKTLLVLLSFSSHKNKLNQKKIESLKENGKFWRKSLNQNNLILFFI